MTMKSIKHNPFKVVQMFEEELSEYTNSRYAVAVDSCTNAIFLCLKYNKIKNKKIVIPLRTYLSVAQTILLSGNEVIFQDIDWSGMYELKIFENSELYSTKIFDSAKRLTSDQYVNNTFQCLSFHIKKTLPIGKGGCVLTDDISAVNWLKKARYEGRSEINYVEDNITSEGWNMYLSPSQACRGLELLLNYPKHQKDLNENDGNGYRALNEFDLFKNCLILNSSGKIIKKK